MKKPVYSVLYQVFSLFFLFLCLFGTIYYVRARKDQTMNVDEASELVLGNNLDRIGEYAFEHCDNITQLEIPSSMRTIDTCAFYCCRSLNDVIINPGLERIEQLAFSECTSLTSLSAAHKILVFPVSNTK